MRIIARRTLREFWTKHPDVEQALKAWHREVERADWVHPGELKAAYPSASILANDRIVFNIKGNHYRLIVQINFAYRICFIRFIGTHADYDKIDATTI